MYSNLSLCVSMLFGASGVERLEEVTQFRTAPQTIATLLCHFPGGLLANKLHFDMVSFSNSCLKMTGRGDLRLGSQGCESRVITFDYTCSNSIYLPLFIYEISARTRTVVGAFVGFGQSVRLSRVGNVVYPVCGVGCRNIDD